MIDLIGLNMAEELNYCNFSGGESLSLFSFSSPRMATFHFIVGTQGINILFLFSCIYTSLVCWSCLPSWAVLPATIWPLDYIGPRPRTPTSCQQWSVAGDYQYRLHTYYCTSSIHKYLLYVRVMVLLLLMVPAVYSRPSRSIT